MNFRINPSINLFLDPAFHFFPVNPAVNPVSRIKHERMMSNWWMHKKCLLVDVVHSIFRERFEVHIMMVHVHWIQEFGPQIENQTHSSSSTNRQCDACAAHTHTHTNTFRDQVFMNSKLYMIIPNRTKGSLNWKGSAHYLAKYCPNLDPTN